MRVVERLLQNPNFGSATVVSYHLPASHQKRAETIETYVLTKRQSIAFAARVNDDALLFLVDYWIAREAQHLSAGGATNELLRKVAELEGKLNYSEMSRRLVQEQLTKYQHYDDSAL